MKKILAAVAICIAILAFFFLFRSTEKISPDPQSPSSAETPSAELAAQVNSPPEEAFVEARPQVPKSTAPISIARKSKPLTPKEIEIIRQEIKVSLSAIYGAQKSFHSEYRRYTTDFKAMGFQPEKMSVKYGFLSPFSPRTLVGREDPRFLDTDAFLTDSSAGKPLEYSGKAWDVTLNDYRNFCRHGCTASANRFELIAVAQLVEGNPPEVWLINQNKELKQIQDGTKPPSP